jgi:DNA-binding CsgD family transcriptional regulator
MILTQETKKKQVLQRLNLKNAENSLQRTITKGTNCSEFESSIIVQKAKEAFRIGEHAQESAILDGQMISHAVSADEPAGKPLDQCKFVRCVLTLIDRKEDIETYKIHGTAARRRQQILRMAQEAKEQGALLTQEDLGLLLGCDVRTIRSDIKKLKDQGLTVPTRGTVKDIGPGVSHKERAILLWLDGADPLEVARRMHHSLHAVERYIQTYCRVVYAQRSLRDIFKTALVVGISIPAAHLYWDLHCELLENNRDRTYDRLEEVMEMGLRHWDAADCKKNPLPSTRRSRKGSQA